MGVLRTTPLFRPRTESRYCDPILRPRRSIATFIRTIHIGGGFTSDVPGEYARPFCLFRPASRGIIAHDHEPSSARLPRTECWDPAVGRHCRHHVGFAGPLRMVCRWGRNFVGASANRPNLRSNRDGRACVGDPVAGRHDVTRQRRSANACWGPVLQMAGDCRPTTMGNSDGPTASPPIGFGADGILGGRGSYCAMDFVLRPECG